MSKKYEGELELCLWPKDLGIFGSRRGAEIAEGSWEISAPLREPDHPIQQFHIYLGTTTHPWTNLFVTLIGL